VKFFHCPLNHQIIEKVYIPPHLWGLDYITPNTVYITPPELCKTGQITPTVVLKNLLQNGSNYPLLQFWKITVNHRKS
jgi:hypothetical protein